MRIATPFPLTPGASTPGRWGRAFSVLAALLLFLGNLLPSLAAQEEDKRAVLVQQVQDFRKLFPSFKERAMRIEAIRALEEVDCPEAVAALREVLLDKDPEVVRAALEVMGGYSKEESLLPVMEAIPETRNKVVKARLVSIMDRSGFVQSLPVLVEVLEEERDLSVRLRIAEALGGFGRKEGVPALLPLLQDREEVLRIAALDALAKIRDRERSGPVVDLLKDKDWRVRAAAVNAVGKIRLEAAIGGLIDLLDGDRERLKLEVLEALWQITDTDFHSDPELARQQWTRLKGLGFKMPSDAEMAKRKAKREKHEIRYLGLKQKTTYHGIPTTSKRILFVVDISGSMDDLVVDREKFKEGGYESFQKLQIVKTELIRTLKTLDRNTFFNIYAFATKIKKWKKGNVRANGLMKRSAIKWVENLRPLGGTRSLPTAGNMGAGAQLAVGKTNTMGALLAAFSLPVDKLTPDQKLEKMSKPRNDLDTIFFLTDGRASTGIYLDRDEILREVRRINRYRRIVIHAIAIGEFEKGFLKLLAHENQGMFVDLGR